MKAILIETDGLDIICKEYPTTEEATKEMKKRYKRYTPKHDFPGCCEGLSHITATEARLVTCTEVYNWKIHEVHEI